MDEFGYLYINGRLKDMIIRGGENIYPKEIEDFLMSHTSIAEAQVCIISRVIITMWTIRGKMKQINQINICVINVNIKLPWLNKVK